MLLLRYVCTLRYTTAVFRASRTSRKNREVGIFCDFLIGIFLASEWNTRKNLYQTPLPSFPVPCVLEEAIAIRFFLFHRSVDTHYHTAQHRVHGIAAVDFHLCAVRDILDLSSDRHIHIHIHIHIDIHSQSEAKRNNTKRAQRTLGSTDRQEHEASRHRSIL